MGQKYEIGKLQAENVAIGSHARAEYVGQADPKRAAIQAEALNRMHSARALLELVLSCFG